MAKGIWSPRLQKWLSLCGLVTTTLLPCLLISFLFSVPILYGASCQLAIFVVNALFFLRKFSYPFNAHLESEQKPLNDPELVSIFTEHAARAQIHDVTLLLDEVKNPRCDSLGWPYANSVSVSKGMLALCRKGFPKKTLAAIFSHELTHIKNGDSAARLVSWLCKSTIELESHLFLVSGLLLGACLAGTFLFGFSFSGLITLVLPLFCSTLGLQLLTQINQLLYQKLNHSLEFMADEGAVELTKDPLSAALMTFEIHFFYSLGNTYQPMAKAYFKRLNDMAKFHKTPTGEIYRQTLHTEQPCENLITHPLDTTRHQVIKDAYPEAFKNLPKIR